MYVCTYTSVCGVPRHRHFSHQPWWYTVGTVKYRNLSYCTKYDMYIHTYSTYIYCTRLGTAQGMYVHTLAVSATSQHSANNHASIGRYD